ncbi:MAG: ribosomal-protein-alanine N-acetyltransferase [Crocinitomix sp.]|jgi:ribosomal-protein-alanine N-acetyltransferase
MKKLPEIFTAQLKLRRMKMSDLPSLIKYANNEKITANIFNMSHPYRELDAIKRYNVVLQGLENENRYIFAITLKTNNELIGEIGLNIDLDHNRAEVGYWIAEEFWGKGIATEALSAALSFGFNTLELHKIFATHFLDNPSSVKVLIKNGMIKEGEFIDHYKINGVYKSHGQYRLTQSEYNAIQKNN